MMNAQQVIDAIHASRATGNKKGLHNTCRLMDALDLHFDRPAVHVAGTNGKGSVCAMLESVLRHAGLHTGLYTSPFLQAYPERIRLGGLPINDELLVKYGEPVVVVSRNLATAEDVHATPFEHGTALALSVFQGEQVDAAVCEVGLGGRVDPTNVLTPNVSVITAIGLDHMHILGDTEAAIAGEKAGIIKPGVPVVCQCAKPEVARVFARAAAEKAAPLYQLAADQLLEHACYTTYSTASYQIGGKLWKNVKLSLPGDHQLMNAMTVLQTVQVLQTQNFVIPDEAVYEGLAHTVWPARLEWCGDLLLDGAHNAHGIAALSSFVSCHLADRKRVLLTGVLTEKLSDDMLAGLRSLADVAVTVTPDSHRAMNADDYAARLHSAGMTVHIANDMQQGLDMARRIQKEQGGVIVACGSLYFAGELRGVLGLPWR